MIPGWVARYVGVPWEDGGRTVDGCDCYGLVRLVLRDQFRVEIPSYEGAYVSAHERDEIALLVAGGIPADGWRAVSVPRPGDAVLFRVLNRPWHIGVVVDADAFLHVDERHGIAVVDRLDGPRWARRRVGVYRHQALV